MADEAATGPQQLASDPHVSAWVGANAGSGKTRVLTQRVARLLLAGAEPGRILCLTYTKSAAAEMQNRLFKLLGEWSMQPNEALGKMLGDLAGTAPVLAPERLAVARRLFARALETPGGLKIQTIHAFCDALLRRFPLEAGVAPGFEVIDERQAALLLSQIQNQMAVAAEKGADPAFDLIAARLNEGDIESLINGILARRADFNSTDAKQLLQRCLGGDLDLTAEDVVRQHLTVIQKYGAEVARVLATGSSSDQKIAQTVAEALESLGRNPVGSAESLMGAVLVKARTHPVSRNPTKPVREANPGIAECFLALAETLLAINDTWSRRRTAARSLDLHRFAQALLAAYGAQKERRALLDFDDLISKATALLSRSDMRAWVLYKLDRGIDHVLVDEAQDTAPAQWDVIAALTDDFHTGDAGRDLAGMARSVFVVGDEKQSIYSFQGAEPWAFGEMRKRYETRIADIDGRLEKPGLITSFRSAPGILQFVDAVFAGEAAAGVTFTGEPIEHRAHRTGDPARVDLWPLIAAEVGGERPHWKDPVDLPPPDHPKRRLARLLAGEIQRIVAEEHLPKRGDKLERSVRPGDILVLVRRRDDLAQSLIQNLKTLGVPVAGADRLTLAAELAVKDVLSLIRAVLNRDDELSLAEVLRSPLCSVSEAELFTLAYGRAGSLWQAVMAREAHQRDAEMLRDLANRAGYLAPFEFLERLLTHHDGRRRLIARLGVEAEDPIDELLAQAIAYEGRETPSLHGFLSWIEAGDIALKREMETGAGEVRVMTIHGAKGLEAPIVILPDTMVQRAGGRQTILPTGSDPRVMLWPGSKAEDDPVSAAARAEAEAREAAEAKRLLYVGLTRAEDWLILCGAGQPKDASGRWYGMLQDAFDQLGGGDEVSLNFGPIRRMATKAWAVGAGEEPGEAGEERLTAPVWLCPAPREARPRRLAPSHLVKEDGGQWTGKLDPILARKRGEAVHVLLERLPGMTEDRWPKLAKALIGQSVPGLGSELGQEAIAEAFAVLQEDALAWIFGPGSLGEVGLSLPVIPGAAAMHGRMDRLIVSERQVTIVDFKSDQAVPLDAAEVAQGYLAQLGAYRAALSPLYPDRPVTTGLLWTRARQFMALSDAHVDAAYQEALAGIDLGATGS